MPPRGRCAEYFLRPEVTFEGHPIRLPARLEGSVHVDGTEIPGTPLTEYRLLLAIHNRGRELWPCTTVDATKRVSFSVSLIERRNRAVTGWELIVPHDVGPDETIELPFSTTLPRRPGAYTLRVEPLIGGEPAASADPELTVETTIVSRLSGAPPVVQP